MLERILYIMILVCLSLLTLSSLFFWQNAVMTILFLICIIVWILIIDKIH